MSAKIDIEVSADLFLTAAQAGEELGVSSSGVYKLIARGQLAAIRRPGNRLLVPRPCLEAVRRGRAGEAPRVTVTVDHRSHAELTRDFEREHGRSPADWLEGWRRGELEDSAENMQTMIHASGLKAREELL